MRFTGCASAARSPDSRSNPRTATAFTLLTATTLWENRAALMLLRRNGFRARHTHRGEIEHELKLEAVGLSPQRCVAGGHEDPQADEKLGEVIGACTSSLPSATACHPCPKPVAYP